jgi:exodeoxyribonuclease III
VNDALFLPESRAAFRRLANLGLTDAVRVRDPAPGVYTFWDYQAGAWERNNGIRIDHVMCSPPGGGPAGGGGDRQGGAGRGQTVVTTCRSG